MNLSGIPVVNAAAAVTSRVPPPALPVRAGLVGEGHLTRVSLARLEPHFNLYLRFGEPVRVVRLERWKRVALFTPGAVLCRIRWQGNDYGTIRWQLMVLQARTPAEPMQRIPGVRPGARLLLHVEGERAVRAVLKRIDAIEALEITPSAVSPAYWETLNNRLASGLPLPAYDLERHVAWLTGRRLQ